MQKKTTEEAIEELEVVDFMFPDSCLGSAYRGVDQLPSLAESN